MILLTCTNCRARLEMDDAFAGGVCRCMYCGTIQTVPSHLKRPGAATKVKAIYQTQPRARTNGAGNGHGADDASGELNQLADVVAATTTGGSSSGSGLAGSGLTGSGLNASTSAAPSPRVRVATFAPPPSKWQRHRTLILAAAGAVCAIILVVALMTSMSGKAKPQAAPPLIGSDVPAASSVPQLPPSATVEPNFCGVPLADDRVVVYVLDRGNATGEMLGDLKEACYRSIQSLGPQRQFQVIFWDNGTTEAAYPGAGAGPTFATPANLEAARKALDGVYPHGQSDPEGALTKAFAANPSAVVLATAKAYELDDSFARAVQRLRKSNRAKVHTVAIGPAEPARTLKSVATSTGGEFRAVSAAALRDHAQ
jgi:hypothetical protein